MRTARVLVEVVDFAVGAAASRGDAHGGDTRRLLAGRGEAEPEEIEVTDECLYSELARDETERAFFEAIGPLGALRDD